MATVEECEAALRDLAERLNSADADTRGRVVRERVVRLTLTDHDAHFRGHFRDGGLYDVEPGDDPKAQVHVRVSSDDLLALADGRLSFVHAWLTGKLSIRAGVSDLLHLRSLL